MTWADLPLLVRVELVLERGGLELWIERLLVSSSCAWTCLGSALGLGLKGRRGRFMSLESKTSTKRDGWAFRLCSPGFCHKWLELSHWEFGDRQRTPHDGGDDRRGAWGKGSPRQR